MQRSFWGCLLLAGFAASAPQATQAQLFTRPFHNCCETCEMPQAQCSCTQAHVQPQVQTQVRMQTRTRPVVQTQLRPQQVTTYRDVTETRVRNESVVENVPSTTYRNVTVDEGGYQMVWVPKPVTKQVAQTVVQQQVKTRAVPYQVTHRVPQVSTQMIPVQTVQHITEQVPVMTTMAVPTPMTFTPVAFQSAATSCNVCDHGSTAMNMPMLSQQFGYAPQVSYAPSYIYGAPLTAAIPTMPAITVPVPQTALAPTPITTERPAEQWQTVPARGASSSRSQEYDSPSSRPVPTPADDVNAIPRRTSMFSPAPSAAVVWNSRR